MPRYLSPSQMKERKISLLANSNTLGDKVASLWLALEDVNADAAQKLAAEVSDLGHRINRDAAAIFNHFNRAGRETS